MDTVGYALAKQIRYVPPTITQVATLDVARYACCAVVVYDKIYILGGNNGSSALTQNCMFDPLTKTYTNKASIPFGKFYFAAAAVVSLGKIYVFEGFNNSLCYEYDINNNVWTSIPSPPVTGFNGSAVNYGNNIYIFGGYWSSVLSRNYMFDPTTKTYSAKASMPTARFGLRAVTNGNMIYVLGGVDANYRLTAVNEKYDPVLNTWSSCAAMPVAGRDFGAAYFPDDETIYIFGGSNSIGVGSIPTSADILYNYVLCYQIKTNLFYYDVSLPWRGGFFPAVTLNGTIYIVNGSIEGAITNSIYAYQPKKFAGLSTLLSWLAIKD